MVRKNSILQNKGKVAKNFETEFLHLSRMSGFFSYTMKNKGFTAAIPTWWFCEPTISQEPEAGMSGEMPV